MKTFSYLVAFLTLLLNFEAQAQCSVVIDAPSAAIANCSGPQISATPTGPGPYLYTWSSPTITFSSTTVADPFISSTTIGWQTIILSIIDTNGCTSFVSDSIQFFSFQDTIYQSYCTYPDSICVLDIPILNNLGWSYTDTMGLTTTLTATDCVPITGPGEYVFSGVYASNCTVIHTYIVTEDCGVCSAVIDAPSAAIASCVGPQIGATATGPGPYQYSWTSPTIMFSADTVANPFISSTSFGWQTITLTIVDSNNCTSVVTDSVQFYGFQDTIYQSYCTYPDSICVLDIPILNNLGWSYTDTMGLTTTLTATDCVPITGPGEYLFSGVYASNCTVIHTYVVTQDCAGLCSAQISAPDVAISNCSGPQVFGTTTGPGPNQYIWSSPTISFTSTSAASPFVSSTTSGWQTFSLIIIDATNCTSYATDSIEFIAPDSTFNVTYCTLPDSICTLNAPVSNLGWTFTDSLGVITSIGSTDCIQITGPGVYTFSGVYQSNCTVIHTYNVTQDCGPGCSAVINAPEVAVSNCIGPQISATPSGSGPYQYTWSSPTLTFSSTSAANPTISSSMNGWHYFSVLIIDALNCTSFTEDSIEFFALDATFDQTYCTLPDSICTIGIPVSNLGWTYTDTLGVTTNLDSTECIAIVGPGVYEFFGIYELNCTVIHTYNLTQDCAGICSATIDAPEFAISNCSGPQVTATATGPAPYQYSWSSPTITFSSTTIGDPFISSTTVGWQYFTVEVIDSTNCTSTVTDSIEFFAPNESFDYTYCSLPFSICTLGTPVGAYSWTYTDTIGVSINLPSTECIQVVGPGVYEFSGVYASNCTVVHTYNVTIDCGAGCEAEIDAPNAAISNCVGPQVNATSTGPGPYQYAWSSPTMSFSSTTVGNPYISSSTQGWQYLTVVIIDGNNCTSTATDSIQFFDPVDTLYQTYCTLPDSVCVLDVPMQQFLSWTYTDSTGTTINLPSTDCVEIVGPGNYQFTGVYESNCTVIHTYVVTENCGGIGIEEISDAFEPFIYPNPATSEINVRLPNAKCDRWEIIDLFGKTCLAGSSDQSEFKIELYDIAAGTYFVRIWNDESVSNNVIIKK